MPHSGVDAVLANRYDVMTHDSRSLRWKSPTMVGSAVETIVWSRAARNMPSISPDMITRIWRWVNPVSSTGGAIAVALIGRSLRGSR